AAAVLAAVLILTALANRQVVGGEDGTFRLTADFGQADGVYVGTPVRVAGINVGAVADATLNTESRAVLTLEFINHVPLPRDTAAVIETDGIFGTKYIELYPGGDERLLGAGERISYTQDAVIIEELIALIVDQARAAARSNTP
ncbi:MAG: MlaD family protein, partial [Rhodospirillaceae bacterium]